MALPLIKHGTVSGLPIVHGTVFREYDFLREYGLKTIKVWFDVVKGTVNFGWIWPDGRLDTLELDEEMPHSEMMSVLATTLRMTK